MADDLSMASVQWLRSLWERDSRPIPVRVLSMVGIAGGLSCLIAAAFPPHPDTPVGLFRVLGAITLVAALAAWVAADRVRPWMLHAAAILGTVGISVTISQMVTGVGMIVTACAYLWIAIYAGFFFSRRAARIHMGLIAVGFGVALLIAGHGVPAVAWVFMTTSLVVAGEVVGRQSDRLRHEAHTDPLTGLLNRKGLAPAAESVFSLADRTGIALTLAIVDLDHFKEINDHQGHAAGDRMLIEFTRIWGSELEPSDLLARLGGDEFLVVLVGSTEQDTARLFERLRFVSPTAWSAGIVTRWLDESLSDCLGRADSELYEAKRARELGPIAAAVSHSGPQGLG
jgi:diguanylate cyclase (GGDEF)-like protein